MLTGKGIPVFAVGMVSEAAPAEPAAVDAALAGTVAKLLTKAIKVLLADIAGLDSATEPSVGTALARAIAKLLSKAVKILLADITGVDSPSRLFSLARPKLDDLIRLGWRGLYGHGNGQRLYIWPSLAHSQTHDEGQAQADSPYRDNDQQYGK